MNIKEKVEKKLAEKGLDKRFASYIITAFAVDTEEAADKAVESFAQLAPAFDTKIEAEKIKKEAVAAYEKTHGLKEGKPVKTEPTKTEPIEPKPLGGTKPDSTVEQLQEQLRELSEQVKQMTMRNKAEGILSQAKAELKKKGVPESWASLINTELEVAPQIDLLAEKYTEVRQSAIDEAVKNGGMTPSKGIEDDQKSDEDLRKLMDGEIEEN